MKKADRRILAPLLEGATGREWSDISGPRGSIVLHSGGWTVDRYSVNGGQNLVISGPLRPTVQTPCRHKGWPSLAVQKVMAAMAGAIDLSSQCYVPLATLLILGDDPAHGMQIDDPPVVLHGGSVGYMSWHPCYPMPLFQAHDDDTIVLPASMPALTRVLLRCLSIPNDGTETWQSLVIGDQAHVLVSTPLMTLCHFSNNPLDGYQHNASVYVPGIQPGMSMPQLFAQIFVYAARARQFWPSSAGAGKNPEGPFTIHWLQALSPTKLLKYEAEQESKCLIPSPTPMAAVPAVSGTASAD